MAGKEKKAQDPEKKKNETGGRKRIRFKAVAICVILLVAFCLSVAAFSLYRYDQGVLEIYADQQDGYVELVMEQIALRDPEATDDEIIKQILGTLDASSGKYWTLSKDDYLVFVKDVLETNRYKGFTTSTYMVEQSADDFLNNLRRNWVTHSTIKMDGDTYIASGVEFTYNGTPYRICLLTNTSVVLDNNAFLSAKITISIMLILILVIVLVAFLTLSVEMDKLKKESDQLNSHIEEQNIKIGELDQEMLEQEQYSSRLNAYHISVLQTFLEKLRERKTYPMQLIKLSFDRSRTRDEFLEHAQMMLDKKVLRFMTASETTLILIFLQYTETEAKTALKRIKLYGEMKIEKHQAVESDADMESIDKEFFE
ncbi:MAG: hypothetical protein IJJ13_07605 [Lachnospiraceae bacterium]|nr:hypothetical protein [Lachnospiraceae bacterium]